MVYLTREQIVEIVERVGQPRASVLLHAFFDSYRGSLSSSDVAELYDEIYFSRLGAHPLVEGAGEAGVNVYNQHSYKHIREHLPKGSRILDVGCGDGSFSLMLVLHGYEVVGIDTSPIAIDEAKRKAEAAGLNAVFRPGDVSRDLDRDDVFDAFVLNDVTEHLSDEELRTLFSALRQHAHVRSEYVIHTPNGLALCNGTDIDLPVRAYMWYLALRAGWRGFERSVDQLYYDQVHINVKSYRQLRRLLLECGLRSVVYYDEPERRMPRLSSNMLVVAEAER